MVNDPFATLLCDEEGKLRDDVLYYRVDYDSVPAALKLGWMPIHSVVPTLHEEFGITMCWISCPCNRKLELPE